MDTMSTHDFTLPPLPTRAHRILLFVAMEAEAAPIATRLGLAPAACEARGATARRGTVAGAEVTLVAAGIDPETRADRIGPVHAAAVLAAMLYASRYDAVANMGTAGGFAAHGLGIADLVLARTTMFHDARVALAGFDAIARAHTRLSPSDAQLAALSARLGAHVGLASSGSSLDATDAELALFARERALAKDMELAALAVVCRTHALPLVALKGITDLVDHHEAAHEAFLRNLARTCARVADAAPVLLEAIVKPR